MLHFFLLHLCDSELFTFSLLQPGGVPGGMGGFSEAGGAAGIGSLPREQYYLCGAY